MARQVDFVLVWAPGNVSKNKRLLNYKLTANWAKRTMKEKRIEKLNKTLPPTDLASKLYKYKWETKKL